MQCDYLEGQILGVIADGGELVIRLDLDESETGDAAQDAVLSMRLKGCPASPGVSGKLSRHLFDWAELFFHETGSEKHLEVSVDSGADEEEVRIDYSECEVRREPYTPHDLQGKLRHLRRVYDSQIEYYHGRTTQLWAVISGLRQELSKEVERSRRKEEFFAGSDKGERYAEGHRCYRRVLDLLDRLQKDAAV